MPKAPPDPIRDKHQAAIDEVLACLDIPDKAIDLINKLLSDAEDIESERDEAIGDADELRDQVEQRDSDQDRALEVVKYWLHDFFYQYRMTKSAREILRIVENAL